MYDRILVPVDGSEDATRALAQALLICRLSRNAAAAAADDAPVRASGPAAARQPARRERNGGDDALDQSDLLADGNAALAAAADLAWEAGIAAEHAMVPAAGRALATAILADAGDFAADLIVLGTHGRKGLRRAILGSVAEAVIRDSPIPVLLPGRPKG